MSSYSSFYDFFPFRFPWEVLANRGISLWESDNRFWREAVDIFLNRWVDWDVRKSWLRVFRSIWWSWLPLFSRYLLNCNYLKDSCSIVLLRTSSFFTSFTLVLRSILTLSKLLSCNSFFSSDFCFYLHCFSRSICDLLSCKSLSKSILSFSYKFSLIFLCSLAFICLSKDLAVSYFLFSWISFNRSSYFLE